MFYNAVPFYLHLFVFSHKLLTGPTTTNLLVAERLNIGSSLIELSLPELLLTTFSTQFLHIGSFLSIENNHSHRSRRRFLPLLTSPRLPLPFGPYYTHCQPSTSLCRSSSLRLQK